MLLCWDELQGVHSMPRPDRVFSAGGVNHVCNKISRGDRVFGATRRSVRSAYVRRLKRVVEAEWIGEAPGRQRYVLEVREHAATVEKTPDGMSHALAGGVRRRSDDERLQSTPGSRTA